MYTNQLIYLYSMYATLYIRCKDAIIAIYPTQGMSNSLIVIAFIITRMVALVFFIICFGEQGPYSVGDTCWHYSPPSLTQFVVHPPGKLGIGSKAQRPK